MHLPLTCINTVCNVILKMKQDQHQIGTKNIYYSTHIADLKTRWADKWSLVVKSTHSYVNQQLQCREKWAGNGFTTEYTALYKYTDQCLTVRTNLFNSNPHNNISTHTMANPTCYLFSFTWTLKLLAKDFNYYSIWCASVL